MRVSLIAAVAKNGVIGKDNDLVWNLPRDMRFFKETTLNHHIIMGRRNYDSIPDKWRPLPKRTNIVVTRTPGLQLKKCNVVNTLEDGLDLARQNGETEAFIIGGGQIYALALELDLCDRMYLTHIDKSFEGDTFFPEFQSEKWKISSEDFFASDDQNEHPFTIKVYDRK